MTQPRSPWRRSLPAPVSRWPRNRFRGWLDPAVVTMALLALGSGFGQFGAVAALGDVARSFGHVTDGATIAEQAGLSGTELGIGLAVLRLASLGGLPLAGWADRVGRRRILLATCGLGLTFTMMAAASPGYWWFVAIFACGRPLLSATNAVAAVSAAELTGATDRAKAVGLIAAGYGVGAGLAAITNALVRGTLGFRGTFALAAVPLASWRHPRWPPPPVRWPTNCSPPRCVPPWPAGWWPRACWGPLPGCWPSARSPTPVTASPWQRRQPSCPQ